MTRVSAVVPFLSLVLLSTPATAKPMYSTLETVRSESVCVVVGRWLGEGTDDLYSIDAEATLLGECEGLLRVGARDGQRPSLPVDFGSDERALFFIDDEHALRWVGVTAAGAELRQGVIEIQGFCDYNAHLVSPRFVTFDALAAFLKGEPLRHEIDAELVVLDPASLDPVSTGHRLQLAVEGADAITSFGSDDSLPTPSAVRFAPSREEELALDFAASPNHAAFTLIGRFVGVHEGRLQAELWFARPFVLTSGDFTHWLNHDEVLRHELRLSFDDGPSWSLFLGGGEHSLGGLVRPGETELPIERLVMADGGQYYYSRHELSPVGECAWDGADRRLLVPTSAESCVHVRLGGGYVAPKLPWVELEGALLQELLAGPIEAELIDEGRSKGKAARLELVGLEAQAASSSGDAHD